MTTHQYFAVRPNLIASSVYDTKPVHYLSSKVSKSITTWIQMKSEVSHINGVATTKKKFNRKRGKSITAASLCPTGA